MNGIKHYAKTVLSLGVVSLFLAGCATAPSRPEGAANVRQQLTTLQSNRQLAVLAPLAIKDAELAVIAAEKPEKIPCWPTIESLWQSEK